VQVSWRWYGKKQTLEESKFFHEKEGVNVLGQNCRKERGWKKEEGNRRNGYGGGGSGLRGTLTDSLEKKRGADQDA